VLEWAGFFPSEQKEAALATVAPKERVNIVYTPATGDANEAVELPMKILMVGDYTNREDDTPLEERKPINVDKDNFEEVLKAQQLELTASVDDKLSDEGTGDQLSVRLRFNSMKDFTPEGIVEQVPELKKLLELRNALSALKGPLGNFPKFKKRIQKILGDDASREALIKELGLEKQDDE
jgi:type VI secretion system protein ImpB